MWPGVKIRGSEGVSYAATEGGESAVIAADGLLLAGAESLFVGVRGWEAVNGCGIRGDLPRAGLGAAGCCGRGRSARASSCFMRGPAGGWGPSPGGGLPAEMGSRTAPVPDESPAKVRQDRSPVPDAHFGSGLPFMGIRSKTEGWSIGGGTGDGVVLGERLGTATAGMQGRPSNPWLVHCPHTCKYSVPRT